MSTTTSLFHAIETNDILTVNSLIQSGTCDVNVQNSRGDTPLHTAVQYNNIDSLRCLVEHTICDVNIQDSTGFTPLHRAVHSNNIDFVRCLLDQTTCNVNIQDSDGDTPLHIAVLVNDIDSVGCMLDHTTCDVNIKDNDGNTSLYTDRWYDKIEIVKCILAQTDCDVNIQNSSGYTPLRTAVLYDYIDIVKCLVEQTTCDVNIQDIYGDTPLHKAVHEKNIATIRCLLDQTTSKVSIQNSRGNTPLHIAVYKDNIDTVRWLLDQTTCNVNIQNIIGKTPLHYAVDRHNIDIVRCLLEDTTCIVNIQDSRGNTPLHKAVLYNDIDSVRYLLGHTTCDVDIQDSRGFTPLHKAVLYNNIDFVRCLLGHTTCDVNVQDIDGCTSLHKAVNNVNIDSVRYIIEYGTCNVNMKNKKGYSPFSTANGLQFLYTIAKRQDVELFHVLIQHNVDVLTNHVNNQLQLVKFILSENDFQSLWLFIQNGLYINSLTSSGENIVHLLAQFYIDYLYIDFSFLFDYGLDFNLINNDGNSPLMLASLLNNSPFIQLLAALPCDVNRQNHQGLTALHLCVFGFTLIKGKLNMMKVNSVVTELCAREYYPRYLASIDILLSLGADINTQDIGRKTVLMLVCMKNDRKLLETLLMHGADVNIVDNHGRSALQYIDLTTNVYDLTCFNLLLSHGCRQSFNQPCLNGNTIIQNVLKFTPLWQIDDIVNFIKFLVFKNVNLQLLNSDDGENFYDQLSLEEFSSESRNELRQILYLSGGSFVQITQILHFEVEENYEASLRETLREKPKEKLYLFANNSSLKEICRRVIRQNTGLAIHDRISELIDSSALVNFLMFTDIDSKRFSLPVQYFIDNDDDDYNSYDLNEENEDYENDYLVYNGCKYLNELSAGLAKREFDLDKMFDSYPDLDRDLDPDLSD